MLSYLFIVLFLRSVSVGVEACCYHEHPTPHKANDDVNHKVPAVGVQLTLGTLREVEKHEDSCSRKESKGHIGEASEKTLHLLWRLGINEFQSCRDI